MLVQVQGVIAEYERAKIMERSRRGKLHKARTAKAVVVTVGQRTATGVEITRGLVAGDRVVIDHVLGLEDGQHLAHKEAGTAP